MKIFGTLCSPASLAITIAGLLLVAPAMLSSSALATVITIKCGQPDRSVVKEFFNKSFTTSSTTSVDLPKANLTVNVPNLETRCVKVRFFAVADCLPNAQFKNCFVGVVEPGFATFPPHVELVANQSDGESHGFEFATTLGQGSHTIQMQALTDGATLDIYHWTFEVEVDR